MYLFNRNKQKFQNLFGVIKYPQPSRLPLGVLPRMDFDLLHGIPL